MKYQNMLNAITNKILNDKFPYTNWIIIGDNSSGKSDLLKLVVKKDIEAMYFIDVVNRYFVVSDTNLSKDNIQGMVSAKEVVERRIEENVFNLTDSFGDNEHIWRLYPLYEKKLKTFINNFLNIEFVIKRTQLEKGFGEGAPTVFIDGVEMNISSGYQAIIRIFSEVIFYCDILEGRGTIVIDEIDEFLSPKYASNIMNFLSEQYEDIRFIVSTHSIDLVSNSIDCNIIVLEKNNYKILDGNDFSSLTDVGTLFEKVFINKTNKHSIEIDDELQRLFNLKILGSWTSQEESDFANINEQILTNVQKLIYKQIKEW